MVEAGRETLFIIGLWFGNREHVDNAAAPWPTGHSLSGRRCEDRTLISRTLPPEQWTALIRHFDVIFTWLTVYVKCPGSR